MEEALRRQQLPHAKATPIAVPAAIPSVSKDTLLRLFIGLNCWKAGAAIAWYVLHHGGEGVTIPFTLRGIERFSHSLSSKTAVMVAIRTLSRIGDAVVLIDHQPRRSSISLRHGFVREALARCEETLAHVGTLPALPLRQPALLSGSSSHPQLAVSNHERIH
ncbi:MAG TPA: hypothetical protein VFR86_17885 [Burkholderiaceae bacterium]|nr:hypothetical protein [Burkholderiaceae bacterium]